MGTMHDWDAANDLLAQSVLGYAIERLRLAKDPHWGARPATELGIALEGAVTAAGSGGHEALRIFRDVLLPSCRPMDDPVNLAYVPTAPSIAATVFDLVVSASSIFAGNWESGAGAVAAENQALRWLADLAGLPAEAGGVFVSGGSAANLSALVTARARYVERHGSRPRRFTVAATGEVHASVNAAARVMDIDVLGVDLDGRGRMTGAALGSALERRASSEAGDPNGGVFAVVATAGTTNAGAVDELDAIAEICASKELWLHVDGAYGLAGLCSPTARPQFQGIDQCDSFGVDPHKWLFAPYDCAALVYRQPSHAAAAHAQHGAYLDTIDRDEWNPADYAYHLSRRARGLPLWFSLVTYGTDAYQSAVEHAVITARQFADEIVRRPQFELLLDPQLSIVLFTRTGWDLDRYLEWSRSRARAGTALIVPTTWQGKSCMRICIVNPRTTIESLRVILDDLAAA
jgi:glutamate/tyrosine decarboxylase-like PLP-dependent enzyme